MGSHCIRRMRYTCVTQYGYMRIMCNVAPLSRCLLFVDRCAEQGRPAVFALTRKRLGTIFGFRKRVSAVALLDYHSVEDMHGHVVQLAQKGREEWAARRAAGGGAGLFNGTGPIGSGGAGQGEEGEEGEEGGDSSGGESEGDD